MYSREKRTRAFLIFSLGGTSDQTGCKEKWVSVSSPPRRPKLLHIRTRLLSDPLQNVMHINWYFSVSSSSALSVCVSVHAEWAASAWWRAGGLFLLVARSLGKPCSCSPLFESLASLTVRPSALREVFSLWFSHTQTLRLCLREHALRSLRC